MVLGMAALAVAATAAAQDDSRIGELVRRVRELEERLRALESGTQPGAGELRRQIDVLTREIEQLKIERERPAVADAPERGLGAAASKVYRSGVGMSLGGYGEVVYDRFDDENDAGSDAGAKDQLDFLRAILYAGYKFSDKVVFNSELEVEHATTDDGIGEVAMEFGYLDFLLRPQLGVRAGLLLMPVGLVNELHEPTAFLGSMRPEVERVILPSTWSEAGLGLVGELGPFAYRTYVVTGLNSEEFTSAGIRSGRQGGARALAEDLAWVGRLDWRPTAGALVGGSLYTGGSAQGRTTPAGEAFRGRVTLGELHADLRYRGLLVRGLWAAGRVGDARAINLANALTGAEAVGREFGGWYAEAGYDLASVLRLGGSSLVPFARYEDFSTQRDVLAGFAADPAREADILTLGAVWKPITQVVFKADYQNRDNRAGTAVDQFNVALGYVF
jgi:hypothetical protein